MQTFLPSIDYEYSAQTLDNKRLNKQILEGYQILKVLSNASPSGAWRNHPAVLMWKGSELELLAYIEHMMYEADFRGIKTINNRNNIKELEKQYAKSWGSNEPAWMKDNDTINRVTTTHKANLYAKDPIYYAEYQWATNDPMNKPCCPKCSYFWPTHPLKKAK